MSFSSKRVELNLDVGPIVITNRQKQIKMSNERRTAKYKKRAFLYRVSINLTGAYTFSYYFLFRFDRLPL